MTPADPATWGLPAQLTENLDRRTQHSKQFNDSGGSKTSLLSSNIDYQILPGEWEPQDLSFRLQGADHIADRHWFQTKVTDAGIEVLDPDTGVGLRWLTPARFNVSGRLAQLSAVGVTWIYSVGPRRLTLTGTVATPLGSRTHYFPYQPLGNASDFAIVGGQAVANGIHVTTPVIIGANERIYPTTGWTKLSGSRLAFTFDDSVLPPEAYPYMIDPTTTLQPGSGGFDAYFNDDDVNTNSGGSTNMHVGDVSTAGSSAYRSIIKFDVSSINSGDIVSDATLSIWEYAAEDGNSVGSWAVDLQKVRRDWVEGEITWNDWKTSTAWTTAGAADTTNDIYAAVSATVTLDGTAAVAFVPWDGNTLDQDVQDFVDGSKSNYGWRVTAPSAESQGTAKVRNSFRSSDHGTASERPKLVVVHAAGFTPRVTVF